MPSRNVRPSAAPKRARSTTNPSSSKKRKLASGRAAHVGGGKGKQRAYDRATIPLPNIPSDDEDENLSDQDVEFFTNNFETGGFLSKLDQDAISRSKKELSRLHKLSKPPPVRSHTDDLLSVDSQHDDEENWSDDTEGSSQNSIEDKSGDDNHNLGLSPPELQEVDFNHEQPYERDPYKRGASWDSTESGMVSRLPIKLPDGTVVERKARIIPQIDSEQDMDEVASRSQQSQVHVVEDVSTGARFGRPAIVNVLEIPSRQQRIQRAKEQIASICRDILGDPESSLGLLRRLHAYSLPQIKDTHSQSPVANDPLIRRLAMISQLAVFKDIIPGYRIRSLTEAEKATKVSQMVAKTREWEQGLVSVYQAYLGALESELKGKTEYAELALKSMCTLLGEATHFNFRTNLIGAIVMRLSKRSWDKSSDLCLQTLVNVFKADTSGVPSLEIVRLLNRMVKERKFNVHPSALSCLLHLRLKSELGGIRASEFKAERDAPNAWESKHKADRKRAKGKNVGRPHMSKNALKNLKEKKEIEAQMREAEAEVDREEKANTQTETLKLLFVLYFRILKAPHWTRLLPVALQGLSRYAHMVNVDFFKDLMQVLKDLITRAVDEESTQPHYVETSSSPEKDPTTRQKLLLITTAFELLSGQGEALNIDLRDFANHLYALILPISLHPDIEHIPQNRAVVSVAAQQSTADLLFRALALAFPVRSPATYSLIRTAAFAKRMVVACLLFPPVTVLRSFEFIEGLLEREPKLLALLSTEDRTADGVYRPDLDDPQLSNPFAASLWELQHLAGTHWDSRVRDRARQLTRLDNM